jgi:hypothetical protein
MARVAMSPPDLERERTGGDAGRVGRGVAGRGVRLFDRRVRLFDRQKEN